jgi:benzodiazapine receptor
MTAPASMQPARAALPALLGWLVLTYAFAALGAIASARAAQFYAQLSRPDWAPPGWLFGPVWTALYLLMALAAWRVGRSGIRRAAPALWLYMAQLALNSLWTWLFFAWHLGALSFACIVVLWVLIAATCAVFARRDRLAGMLLWPYLAWVSFAGALCFSVWQRNPALWM